MQPLRPQSHDRESTQRSGAGSAVSAIIDHLQPVYPDAEPGLRFANPFELLVGAILWTNVPAEDVNAVTVRLLHLFPDPARLAQADRLIVEEIIRPLGFARQKARYLTLASQMLVTEFGGEVPQEMQSLVRLPGVSRKVANTILAEAFGVADGVVVDNHVKRVAMRLGLADGKSVEAVEQRLVRLVPPSQRIELSHLLARHGKAICLVRQPLCAQCVLRKLCPSARLFNS